MKDYHPLKELFLFRMRIFYREPEAVFWSYGFPLVMTIALGVAFRNKPPDQLKVAVEDAPALSQVRAAMEADPALIVVTGSRAECEESIRKGDAVVAVLAGADIVEYRFDPTRPEAAFARLKVDEVIQRARGRTDLVPVADAHVTAPGARYVDFVVPGLLGLNLMAGGLWGIGFVTVDMRIRKLLKRLVASPMRKRDFLLSLIGSRMVFTVPELLILLLTGWLLFGIAIEGNLVSIALVTVVGALSFAGMGLLTACRAKKLETISGLMNLVMLPMWIFSGAFFSSSRFPDAAQPFIQALPLTQLNNALRAVITDGASLASQWMALSILAAYGGVSFILALRWFRWT